jgi:hypothetical protein
LNNDVRNKEKNENDYKETKYIRTSYEYVINYEIFSKVLKLVDPNKFSNDKTVQIYFDLIDFDGNKLLGI